jgi:hypothetical protein
MGWETIIPTSTINIRPTMMLREETHKPRYPRAKTHAQTRTEAPHPLATPKRRSERKGSNKIAGKFFGSGIGTPPLSRAVRRRRNRFLGGTGLYI